MNNNNNIDTSFVTINKTLDLLENCEDVSIINEKLYLLVNYLTNSSITYFTSQDDESNNKYRYIVTKLYNKLYNNNAVIILLISHFYIRRINDYIPLPTNNKYNPVLTESFVGPITLQNLIITAGPMKKEISEDYLINVLKLNTENLFQLCDFWISFNFKEYNLPDMLDTENSVFLEIVAALDCERLIDKFESSIISSIENFLLVRLVKIMIKDTDLVSEEFNIRLLKCYSKLSENEFLKHYLQNIENSSDETSKLENQLIFNMIPIMEILDHSEENYIDNDQFLNLLSNGLTSLLNFLNADDPLNILKIHEVLFSKFMKSKYTLLSVLEIAKISLVFHMIELLDSIHFAKFSKLLPLSFYKDFLPNLPTITKHPIWDMPSSLKTFDSFSSKFINLNLCLCLLQKLITSCWDCYNSLQVSIPMDFNLHKLFTTGNFIELYYFKQLSYTLSDTNGDSIGCYDHLFIDSYRRLIFENCLESRLSIFKNWQLITSGEQSLNKAFSNFIQFIIIHIWNENQHLKLITSTIISDIFFTILAERNSEFNKFLKEDKFVLNNLKNPLNQFEGESIKNVKISKLLKSLVVEEDDLEKLDSLLSDMKNTNDDLAKTSQRLSLQPTPHNIYLTPEKFNTRTSPTQKNIDLSFKELRLETDNLSFSNISPQSAIIHSLASPSEKTDKNQQFGRKMSTHIDSFV
ncbi:hypothetical protein HANVADRAFT_51488 [Hanseniaspora valbyensis NRRL Y-1626]|uniref:Uncharacterized protein n=1 Tax=Hanseniaspora valbyensis NRRL Y-1626 TaxID=766949 RepID=A0A1B7TIZ4_9ASCO|nr:hypothetical protein HANVADRAFT_51488 [Hanseniaspora valbyensis NRRL Y-1626]